MGFELRVTENTPVPDVGVDAGALISHLESLGKFRQVNMIKMAEAKRLYVRDMMRPRAIKERLGVPMSDIERWAITMGWDEEREQFELDMFRKVGAIRANYIPNIDKTHDRMFASLELLIEDTIIRAKDEEEGIDIKPSHLVSLANALKTCMEARRTIQGKAAEHKTLAVEILQREGVLENFKQMAGEIATRDHEEIADVKEAEFVTLPDHSRVEDLDTEDELDAYDVPDPT